MSNSIFMIIDGNALLHRAWHALPQTMKAPSGEITNAAYGFIIILLKALKDIHPKYIAVTFDTPGTTFRDKLYKEYKAHRKKKPQELYDQIPMIQKILDAFGIKYFQKQAVEADDIIGTLVKKEKNKNLSQQIAKQKTKVIIVTGDLDVLQLVDEDVEVYTLKRGITETAVYNIEEVKKRYDGLMPQQLIDFKALRGDPSDNIHGAPGIGEKTAILLLKNFHSIENLYNQLKHEGIKELSKKYGIKESVLYKVKNSKKDVLLSKKLVAIKNTVQLAYAKKSFAFGEFNIENVICILQKYAFRSLLKEVQDISHLYGAKNKKSEVRNSKLEKRYVFIQNEKQLRKFLEEFSMQKMFVLDVETDGLDVINGKPIGISFCWENNRAYYIEIPKLKTSLPTDKNQNSKLKEILEDAQIKKIGHNIKFDWQVLRNIDINLDGIYFDTMVAAYVLNPGIRQYSLESLVFQYFGVNMQRIEELIGEKGKQAQLSMKEVDPYKVARYSAEDGYFTWKLYQKLKVEIHNKKIEKVLFDIEMPLVSILGAMERTGISLNKDILTALGKQVNQSLIEISNKIYELSEVKFNIASPQQLKEILFDKLKITTTGIKKTKTGISTAAPEMEKLRGKHPIIDYIFEHRELAKLKSTYIDALPLMRHTKTGRIHTSFNQTITATGRLSSSNPNMQNIPIRTDLGRKIRQAFIASARYCLVSFDYSQIDLRVAAHMSSDPDMIKTFIANSDIHSATAAKLFGKSENEITEEERKQAKEANFGVLYGLGHRGLSQRLGISNEEAKNFISLYRAHYPQVFLYLLEVIETTRKRGYAETLYGRRRYLPDINSGSPIMRAAAERAAINMPVQGTAADIIKKAMIGVSSKLKAQSSKPQLKAQNYQAQNQEEIKMLLQVHDELVFEVREDRVAYWAEIIKYEMENAAKLKVPLKVDVKSGKNWGEMDAILNDY